jgi:hypothetical protein
MRLRPYQKLSTAWASTCWSWKLTAQVWPSELHRCPCFCPNSRPRISNAQSTQPRAHDLPDGQLPAMWQLPQRCSRRFWPDASHRGGPSEQPCALLHEVLQQLRATHSAYHQLYLPCVSSSKVQPPADANIALNVVLDQVYVAHSEGEHSGAGAQQAASLPAHHACMTQHHACLTLHMQSCAGSCMLPHVQLPPHAQVTSLAARIRQNNPICPSPPPTPQTVFCAALHTFCAPSGHLLGSSTPASPGTACPLTLHPLHKSRQAGRQPPGGAGRAVQRAGAPGAAGLADRARLGPERAAA